MIDRYIYDVVRRLPATQREDISRELGSLIDDMTEERADNGKTERENAEDVLMELGSPFALAGKYREGKKYLIGPAYYDQYWFVLKIVLIAVTVGMVIAAVVQGAAFVADTPGATQAQLIEGAASAVGSAVANVVLGLVQGFAWVTVIFAIIERCSLKIDIREAMGGAWKPGDLEDRPVPSEQAVIKKGDSIAGIVFTVAVIILFNFAPYLMSVWLTGPDGALHFVPLFDLGVLNAMLPLFNICFALALSARRCAFLWEGIRCGLAL
jgi:hypothetical protein